MAEVVGVRFKKVGKAYYFDPGSLEPKKGTPVIVETSRGIECGEVIMERREVEDDKIVKPLKSVIRAATAADHVIVEQNEKFERDAFKVCEERIKKHGLEMKLIATEYTFDRSKILFYFSAEGRVDFRELVKDLAGIFRTRIELRQIGVRDEAKMIGGLGICGCPLCCSTFLDEFQPVSINMAKEQGLSLNPTKISGTCGRLMCCLKYESETYQDLLRTTPPAMSLVETPNGRGTVIDSSLLKCTCKVRLSNNPDSPPVTLPCADCRVLRFGKDKGEPLPQEPENPPVQAEPKAAPEVRPASASPIQPEADAVTAETDTLFETPDVSDPAGGEKPKKRRRSHRGGRGRSKSSQSHEDTGSPSPEQ